MVETFTLKNGNISQFRDKLNNEHIDVDTNLEIRNGCIDRYEIYSVFSNSKLYTIGDLSDNGIISDFFVVNDEIYVRFTNVLKNDKGVKLKKHCIKL